MSTPKRISFWIHLALTDDLSPVNGYRLHRYFGCHHTEFGWNVSHLPTGWRVQTNAFNYRTQAARFVRALVRRYGSEAWNFTDPQTVAKKKVWKGSGPVVRALEARARASR